MTILSDLRSQIFLNGDEASVAVVLHIAVASIFILIKIDPAKKLLFLRKQIYQ